MSGNSNVGSRALYEAGDQRNYANDEINNAERFKEGKPNSHLANDSKDSRTIANKLAREEQREDESEEKSLEQQQREKDATLPARAHGNEPSRGAVIDQELREDEEEMMKKKGSFGPK
ncbi:hypothetical protein M501DRAFT_1004547 [Patellaria atrata CBS 101060]|uniref:Uncharacterized protein n=1 Tax=Patellaria atrata CBS 101060 TaxID=1346257 RepID=A0A9P4SA26_9PEZI|nr:hypothetical protein M501DRAFT_1004547 [Patellaria atrata CBS 101060]